MRLSRPDDWARDYWIAFDRFRGLDRVRTVHGTLTGVDLAARQVVVERDDGTTATEDYDALVISTGVTNGFWRRPTLQSAADVGADLRAAHDRLADADVGRRDRRWCGGGQQRRQPRAHLAGQARRPVLPRRAPAARAPPEDLGPHPAPARPTSGSGCTAGTAPSCPTVSRATRSPAGRCSGAPGRRPPSADAVLWAIGRVTPNTGWLPSDMLDDDGFVRVDARPAGARPARCVRRRRRRRHRPAAQFGPQPGRRAAGPQRPRRVRRASRCAPTGHRSGGGVRCSGLSPTGWRSSRPNGRAFRFPAWSIDRVLQPLIVRRGIYGGVRD